MEMQQVMIDAVKGRGGLLMLEEAKEKSRQSDMRKNEKKKTL